jgi:tRNA A-37 threonylcarbamoyl transferase component Bud32
MDRRFFSPAYWRQQGCLTGQARGRGSAYAVEYGRKRFFLRHYRRGGAIGPYMKDRYLWTGLDTTRAWREFYLLLDMHAKGLPVPRPAAAYVQRIWLMYYADIITEQIPDALPLGMLLNQKDSIDDRLWTRIGSTLQHFHSQGICHPDLNVNNILIDKAEAVWLIDFDKGVWYRPKPGQRQANLNRLRRSLAKVWPRDTSADNFHQAWKRILRGYDLLDTADQ